MSWLRNSPLTSSFSSKRSPEPLPKDCDPEACLETFKKHWQQAYEIIEKTLPPECYPVHDDVLGVVNHVGQMGTLLVVELENSSAPPSSPSPCLEHLLSEAILERLFEWSQHTGRFLVMVKQEQMKLYEKLVSRAGQSLLVHESFLKPLLRLLASCGNTAHVEHDKQLVLLLRQICVTLTQNTQLLDLFFTAKTDERPASFPLFSLLIPFVNRSGPIGQQARDALLLCMSMSRQHEALGAFIANSSFVCEHLATTLSGLYSTLPRTLEVECEDWHRLTTDDVNELEDLTLFVIQLECCNAIVQTVAGTKEHTCINIEVPSDLNNREVGLLQQAHKLVAEMLIELINNGFLIPVMGTALLQSTEDALIAATAYFELFLRSTTALGLRPTLSNFLMRDCYDEKRILNTLLERIRPDASPKLRVVTLALMETLVNLDCEEVMHELVFKYLTPCAHVMLSQRARLRDADAFTPSALKLLTLAPEACQLPALSDPPPIPATQGNPVYGLRPEESLYSNFHAYLCDARARVEACTRACETWRFPYDGESPPAEEEMAVSLSGDSSGYESLVAKGSPSAEGGGSPRYIMPSHQQTFVQNGLSSEGEAGSPPKNGIHSDAAPGDELNIRLSATPALDGSGYIGPFLNVLIGLVERMPQLSLQENLRLTGIISRLAVYPQPLLTSLLLNHSLVFQPNFRSFFQALRSLKQSLDDSLKSSVVKDLITRARDFLLQREERLASIRKTAVEIPLQRRPLEPFSRGESKRRSISSKILSSMFGRTPTQEQLVENDTPGSGYKYVRGRAGSGLDPTLWNSAVCAVLVDEWLKELAAIAQEQMLQSVSAEHLTHNATRLDASSRC